MPSFIFFVMNVPPSGMWENTNPPQLLTTAYLLSTATTWSPI